jgi:hypothetical protein
MSICKNWCIYQKKQVIETPTSVGPEYYDIRPSLSTPFAPMQS